jgi:hypothetical protein
MMVNFKNFVHMFAVAFSESMEKILHPSTLQVPKPAHDTNPCGGHEADKPKNMQPTHRGIEGQRLAILCRLKQGPATVEQLTTDCNEPDPRARVHELRGDGHRIETQMIERANPDGSVKRVGLYVLSGVNGQGGDK